jgi:hypothetical protein
MVETGATKMLMFAKLFINTSYRFVFLVKFAVTSPVELIRFLLKFQVRAGKIYHSCMK